MNNSPVEQEAVYRKKCCKPLLRLRILLKLKEKMFNNHLTGNWFMDAPLAARRDKCSQLVRRSKLTEPPTKRAISIVTSRVRFEDFHISFLRYEYHAG